MKYMRPMAIAAMSASLMAAPAVAGGIGEPLVDTEVIVEDTAGTSGGLLIPILLLVLIAVALSQDQGCVEGSC